VTENKSKSNAEAQSALRHAEKSRAASIQMFQESISVAELHEKI